MKKNLKHRIKQDDLVTGFERLSALVAERADEFKIGAVVVLVLAAGAFALQHFRSQRHHDASQALSQALETFRAPVTTEIGTQPPEPGSRPPFPTATEKYTKALTELDGVHRNYPSLPMGVRARYYAALCRIELGQNAEAEKALKEISAMREGLEPALARLALAGLQERTGQIDAAADAYKQIEADASFALPRDHALARLAKMYEEARRPVEAHAAYQQLIDKYPESAYVSDARRRVEFLQARG